MEGLTRFPLLGKKSGGRKTSLPRCSAADQREDIFLTQILPACAGRCCGWYSRGQIAGAAVLRPLCLKRRRRS